MKILIFGATGETGKVLVKQALEKGHIVTAFARNPAKVTITDKNLHVFTGDAMDSQKVVEAINGQDAVISVLGTRKFNKAAMISETIKNIVDAMKQSKSKRFILMSAFGVGDSFNDASIPYKIVYKTIMRTMFEDKLIQEQYVKNSNLNWTIIEPVTLSEGPKTENYTFGEHVKKGLMPSISREDVADLMLKVLEDEKYFNKTLQITS